MSVPFAFDLENVSVHYPETVALNSVSLTVPAGECVAVLGANGSGKSTLLRVLGGLCMPQMGTVRFCGEPVNEECLNEEAFANDFRRRVGIVFQNPDVQLFNPTVFDEVAFGPMQMGWGQAEVLERVEAAMEDMQISHLRHRSPHWLSGGEKKRVALASVLVLNPEVLLLDEPTAALDPKSQGHMIDFLFGCLGKKTVITTTHSLDIVDEIATRCIVLEEGRLAATGPVREILGDRSLLERTHLIHAHRHRHSSGIVHSHPHPHGYHAHDGGDGEP